MVLEAQEHSALICPGTSCCIDSQVQRQVSTHKVEREYQARLPQVSQEPALFLTSLPR